MDLKKLTPTQLMAYEEIKAMVERGGIRVLPTEIALARKIGISKPIVHKVLSYLTADGVIPPVVGKRRFLKNPAGVDDDELSIIAVVNKGASMATTVRQALWHNIVKLGYSPAFIDIMLRDTYLRDRISGPILKLKGVIVTTVWDAKVFEWLETFGCPVIVLDHISNSRRFMDILPDERKGCRKILQLFKKRGVSSVVYVDYCDESWNPPRWDAFVSAAESLGIEVSDRVFIKSTGDNQNFWDGVASKVRRGMGLFCANFWHSVKLTAAMEKYQLKCPEDYFFACVADSEVFINGRSITRYSLNWEQAAYIACQSLDGIIKKSDVSMKRRYFPVKFFKEQTL